MAKCIGIFVVLAATCSAANAAEQHITVAGLSVTVWTTDARPSPQPVVVFSHGLHGCATQSRFLMEALASAGYLVFAPNHRDASCEHRGGREHRITAEQPLGRPADWTPATYHDRADDVRRLLDALQHDARFRERGDWTHLALAGHSLGGYTVLGLAGAWAEWRLPGVKAVLALSPYAQPFQTHRTLGALSTPVMYQGGTRDVGITPWVRQRDGSYAQSPAPKYFVEFDKAGHLAWTNLQTAAHASIVAYSLAFLDHYVKGVPAAAALTRRRADVVDLRYESELGVRAGDGAPR